MIRHTIQFNLVNRHPTQGIYKLSTDPSLCLRTLMRTFTSILPPPSGWPCPCGGQALLLPSSLAVLAGIYNYRFQLRMGPMPQNTVYILILFNKYFRVLIYLPSVSGRNGIKCECLVFNSVNDLEFVGLKIILSPLMSFIIICVYRPPSVNDRFYKQLTEI